MPKLEVEGVGSFEVTPGRRLVTALTDVAGVDQLHACGGLSRCTTCRVEVLSGNPEKITQAEKETLLAKGITDPAVRLSCQVACDGDLKVRCVSRLEGSGRKDAGKRPNEQIEPTPVWTVR
jgi:ferredoxin